MSADPLVTAYLQHVQVEKKLAARTLALYTEDLAKLQSLCAQAGVSLSEVNSTHMRRWVMGMHASGRSARGIALIASGWRGFYKWLGKQGLMSTQPMDGVRTPKVPKPLPKALAVDEAVQLADHKNLSANTLASAWLEARDLLTVELLYGSGLRIAELLALDCQASAESRAWVDAQAGMATVTGKGNKVRTVPVGKAALAALSAWLAVRDTVLNKGAMPSNALLINRNGQRLSDETVRTRLRARAQAAGLQAPVHPHMLRHSFASHVLQSSQDLRGVQELLGHANIGTTQVYTRLDFQHLAEVYDATHPRAKHKP